MFNFQLRHFVNNEDDVEVNEDDVEVDEDDVEVDEDGNWNLGLSSS